MRLFSWNLAAKVRKQTHQLELVLQADADVIALQEITQTTQSNWMSGLSKEGYNVICSFDYIKDKSLLTGARRYGVLIASRWDLEPISPGFVSIPWEERLLSLLIDSPWGSIELHNIHMPAGVSHKKIKIETFEKLYQHLAQPKKRMRLLCGDFNSPRKEYPDGSIVTWGKVKRHKDRRLDNDSTDRQANAERSIFTGLAQFDLIDVYRCVNGYEIDDYSWMHKWRERRTYRRFDHIFASSKLKPIKCGYHHEFLDAKLSDHAPIEAEFLP